MRQQNIGNDGTNASNGFRGGSFGNINRPERWQLNEADIQSDLTATRPKWILSSYGPSKDTPAALFVENEYSPEEVRWRYYQQESTGNGISANQEAQNLWQKAENDMLNVSRNVKDVQKFMEEQERQHPNRHDYCKMDGTVSKDEFAKTASAASAASTTANPFPKPAFGSNPFGQAPKTFGQSTQQASPFSPAAPAPAFGQPAQGSAFGRPAQPSAFGKPAFGQSSTPAFGQSGFGQGSSDQTTSKFGGPIQNQSPFGTAAAQQTTAFGQPSSLGQNASVPARPAASGFGAGNSFGQPAQPSAFGKPAFGSAASLNTNSPFGAGISQNNPSPFGSGAAQNTNPSPFGSGSTQNNNPSPFGPNVPSNNASPFGNASPFAKPAGGFGTTTSSNNQQQPQQTSPFGQAQQQSNPFGQHQQQPQQSNPFGQAQPQHQQANPFGQPQQLQQTQQANPFGQSQKTQQPQQTAANQNPFGKQPSTGLGTQNQPASSPFGQTASQPTPIQPTPATGIAQISKPTDKPVKPLHYTQSLPLGTTQVSNGQLSIYRNHPVEIIVTYRPTAEGTEVEDTRYPVYSRPDGKGLERIWFPGGAGEVAVQKLGKIPQDFQDEDKAYDQQVKDQYKYLFETGRFKDHIVPLVPPERTWIEYDF